MTTIQVEVVVAAFFINELVWVPAGFDSVHGIHEPLLVHSSMACARIEVKGVGLGAKNQTLARLLLASGFLGARHVKPLLVPIAIVVTCIRLDIAVVAAGTFPVVR